MKPEDPGESARRFGAEAIVAGGIILGGGLLVLVVAVDKGRGYRNPWMWFLDNGWLAVPICVFGALLLAFGLVKVFKTTGELPR